MRWWWIGTATMKVVGRLLLGFGLACIVLLMVSVMILQHSWHGPR